MPNASDPLSAEMASTRSLLDAYAPLLTAAGNPLGEKCGRLLKAVDVVLAMTADSGEPDLDWDGNPERGVIRVIRCDLIRAAIERELARKDGSAQPAPVWHQYPEPFGSPLPCCGLLASQVPEHDRIAFAKQDATCGGPPARLGSAPVSGEGDAR